MYWLALLPLLLTPSEAPQASQFVHLHNVALAYAACARGFLLAQFIRPGMGEAQVIAVLGHTRPEFVTFSGGAAMWSYPCLGIQVFWSGNCRVWAPGERIL